MPPARGACLSIPVSDSESVEVASVGYLFTRLRVEPT